MTLNELVTELQQRTGLGEAEIREVVRAEWPFLRYFNNPNFDATDLATAERIIRQKAAPLSEGQGRV